MSRRTNLLALVVLSVVAIFSVSGCVFAQEQQQEEQSKPAQEKTEPSRQAAQSDVELKSTIKALADQIKELTSEIRRLRHATELNADSMRLLISEDRLAKVQDDINAAVARKSELDSAEQTLQYRLANIQQELIVRGGLNREDSEAAIRADLNRSLQNVHAQQAANQTRITELRSEESTLNATIRKLRKKLGLEKTGDEGQNQ